jgi:hypothetical protein
MTNGFDGPKCAAGPLAVAFPRRGWERDMTEVNWRARWEEDADGGMSVLLELIDGQGTRSAAIRLTKSQALHLSNALSESSTAGEHFGGGSVVD